LQGCAIALTWSSLWFISPFWPSSMLLSTLCSIGLIGANSTFIYNTFFKPRDRHLKEAFATCRKLQCNVVLGDWLSDDYDERIHQVKHFDEIGCKIHKPAKLLFSSYSNESKHNDSTNESTFHKIYYNLKHKVENYDSYLPHEETLTLDDALRGNWVTSYRDAINNRRLDLLACVLNNVEGSKILMAVNKIDNIPNDIVKILLTRRLTGNVPVEKAPFKFDPYFERVQVVV